MKLVTKTIEDENGFPAMTFSWYEPDADHLHKPIPLGALVRLNPRFFSLDQTKL